MIKIEHTGGQNTVAVPKYMKMGKEEPVLYEGLLEICINVFTTYLGEYLIKTYHRNYFLQVQTKCSIIKIRVLRNMAKKGSINEKEMI